MSWSTTPCGIARSALARMVREVWTCSRLYGRSVLPGAAPCTAQAAPPIEWRLNADADSNGVADGWTTAAASGQVTFRLAGGGQQVAGARADDRLERTASALDREAVYLLTAALTVTRGGLLWGADGFPRKYVAAYSRPVESRTTCRGRDSLTIAFSGLETGSDFTVTGVRLEKVQKRPLPLEADTGRFLVPRPRLVRYQSGETAGCVLDADTPMLLAGLEGSDVSLELMREDLGFKGAAKFVADGERGGVPALVVGTLPGLQARTTALPADQDGAGTVWFDDLRVTHGGVQLRNLVHTGQSLRVTDVDGAPLEAGRDYEVRPGETSFPFTDEAVPWHLVRLPLGRIPAGGEVRVSYEYAPAGSVTYCPSRRGQTITMA